MESTSKNSQWKVAEVQLTYQSKVKPSERPKIHHSKDVADVFRSFWNEDQIELVEQFHLMLLNRANRVIGIAEVSRGGMVGTVADPKIIYATALKAAACQIIVAHNHPSGNRQPSQADILLTRKLKAGGELLEIKLLDHLIFTSEGYLSMADEGLF